MDIGELVLLIVEWLKKGRIICDARSDLTQSAAQQALPFLIFQCSAGVSSDYSVVFIISIYTGIH